MSGDEAQKRHGTMRRTARKMAREEATQKILRWRTEENMSLEECAEQIGCSKSTAYEYEKRALAELASQTVADAEQRRAVMTEQLREVRRAHWDTRAEPRSAEIVLKTFEQERKLWGLDAPEKQVHGVITDSEPTPAQAAEVVRALFGRVTPPSEPESTASGSDTQPDEPKPA